MKWRCRACLIFYSMLVAYAQQPDPPTQAGSAEQALLDDLPVVQTAALHQQTLQEAPANVTVITAAQIRNYGYRTLGEALNSVRGFYSTYDRLYHYMGVSGFGLPGDYNTRFLVMINGHAMTEHAYDSNNSFGQDFGLDMDLVERIEIIRGSASALYGSNSMLATINVITRSPADLKGLSASFEAGSFGEKKASLSDSIYLGKGANLLLAGSFFDNSGRTLFIPEFNSPATNNGIAVNADGEIGYHLFANLIWDDWSITALFDTRRKSAPVNWSAGTVFNDGGSHLRDGRNFIEASHSRDLGTTGKLRYRFYYDDYRYDDRFDYDFGYIEDQRSLTRSEWLGSEISYSVATTGQGVLTLGTQGEYELRNLQQEFAVTPARVDIVNFNVPDRSLALFAHEEWKLSRRWKVYGGLRFDRSHNYGNALSPRLALVYQRSPNTVYKIVYGRPFRNPSAYEKYYTDNETVTINPKLGQEHAHTFELSAEHKFRHNFGIILDAYQYRMVNLIKEVFQEDTVPQYQNVERSSSTGLEVELSAKPYKDVEFTGSATIQHTVDSGTRQLFPNSPRALIKGRAGLPLVHGRLYATTSVNYMSARLTVAGDAVSPVLVQDFTLTSRSGRTGLSFQLGIRNLWNASYDDPVGLAMDTIRQDRRSFYLKATWGEPH